MRSIRLINLFQGEKIRLQKSRYSAESVSTGNVTLLAITMMVLVAIMTLPLIFGFRAWDAWQAIPRDVYARNRMTLFHLRSSVLWIAWCIINLLGRTCQWLQLPAFYTIIEPISIGFLGLLLTAHMVWSFRLINCGHSSSIICPIRARWNRCRIVAFDCRKYL